MRVVVGFVVAAGAIGVGALSFDRRNPLLGNVLTAAGLGIASITLFAATRGYGLLSPEVGLLAALVAALAAAVIAIRYDAREVAAYGLVAALIAPPVMGASATTLTLLFVAVTLIGTTAIALFRLWRWLPSIAFVLAAPQLALWLVSAGTVQALVALAGFWLLNILAAGGEEVRIRRDDLRPSSATLVLANAAFLIWGGNVVLGGPVHPWLGGFVAVASVAHLAVGGAFLRRQGLEHLFGNLVAGTGLALVALAAFVQLGAALVPVAWAMEAAALAWLGARRLHRWSVLAALVLGSLAALHLAVVEHPLDRLAVVRPLFDVPLLHPEAASLAAVLAAAAATAWFVHVAWIRSALAAVGTTLLPVAVVGDRALSRLPDARRLAFIALPPLARGFASGAGAVAWVAALMAALGSSLAPMGWVNGVRPSVPFTDESALVAVVLAGAAIAAWSWAASRPAQQGALLAALVPLAVVIPLEVGADFVVVLWLVAAGAALAVTRRGDALRPVSAGFAGLVGTGAIATTLGFVAPPDRLWVAAERFGMSVPALLPGWWLAVGALALSAAIASRRPELAPHRPLLKVAAAAAAVYLASVAVVDPFQRMVGGSVTTEELAKQAQVAMSVMWTGIGALALGVGLRARFGMARHIGFGLLALATAKVFMVDLAAMNVAYRALVLAGLGVLLLVSAWLFTHLRGQQPGTPGGGGLPGPRAAG